MTSRITLLSLVANDPDRVAAFWQAAGKDRLHLDLRADGTTFADELDRLLTLGATRADVGRPADAAWEFLADPEGNVFCLLGRTVQEVEAARA